MIAVTSIAPLTSWRDHAECRGVDPGIFHPDDEEENEFSAEAAKTICMSCPVRTECLAEALDNQIEWGVWGGMTERERRALLRRRPNASWRSVLEAARKDHETVPASF